MLSTAEEGELYLYKLENPIVTDSPQQWQRQNLINVTTDVVILSHCVNMCACHGVFL